MLFWNHYASSGNSIKEYCVYPNPGYTDSTNGLQALYSGWSVDRPDSKPYFGFKGSALTTDGSQNILIGSAIFSSGPNSQKVLVQLTGGGWNWISFTLLPTATPTPTPTDPQPPSQPLCLVAIVTGH